VDLTQPPEGYGLKLRVLLALYATDRVHTWDEFYLMWHVRW